MKDIIHIEVMRELMMMMVILMMVILIMMRTLEMKMREIVIMREVYVMRIKIASHQITVQPLLHTIMIEGLKGRVLTHQWIQL
jgi:phage gp16-like protein